jgi:uncharacterized iron-regulated membrane protein
MRLRPIFFWAHLVAGVTAGVVIFIMSLTGFLLMYERQILAWADSGYRSTAGAPRLTVEEVVTRFSAAQAGLTPTNVTVKADPEAPVVIAAGQRTFFVDAYSGLVLGESSRAGVRRAMSTLREWHRYIALSGDARPTGKAITGWSNFIFLFIVCSGCYLWLPKQWTWRHFRAVLLFNPRLSGKARDFNWHNVIGIWSFVALFFVVLTAMPISFQWAGALIYRAVGEQPPVPTGGQAREATPRRGENTRRGERPAPAPSFEGIGAAWTRAEQQVEGWRSIALRMPNEARAPYVFTIDRGDGGQPHLRDTLTIARSGEVVSFEPFTNQSLGRRLRSLARFTHTGEAFGIVGQTIAGLVSGGGVVLVWTGLALAWRRFFRRARADERRETAAA